VAGRQVPVERRLNLRTGIAYDQTPVRRGQPDDDRAIPIVRLAFGARWKMSETSVDMGYAHIFFWM
jgi:long-subunit fatty acid transport protein